MAETDSDFLKRLRATFDIEAAEHLDALFSGVTELERATDESRQVELIEAIFREAHSLKGAAGSVSRKEIERVCQSIETTFAAMKRRELELSPELFNNLHQALDRIKLLLHGLKAASPEQSLETMPSAAESGLHAGVRQTSLPQPNKPSPAEKKPVIGTVRIAAEKLDSIFLQVEEMLAAKLIAGHRKQELQKLSALAVAHGREWLNIRAHYPDWHEAAEKRSEWQPLVEQNIAFIKTLTYQLGLMAKSADQDQRMIARMVDDLLEDMKKVLMLPFSTITESFPKLVRDLASDSGKQIDLSIQGGELEADRRILEEIKDPLIHLVRNCIDHGIEKPEERTRRHKPAQGKVVIAILPRSGDQVDIKISDDGAGIDVGRVKATAQRLGLLSNDDASGMDEREAVELVYHSGISTSPIITEISGRGLGLAIVREKVEKLGGTIALENHPGAGTSFNILLPNTLATYRGIAVRLKERQFVLPTRSVEQSLRIPGSAIQTVENRETIAVGNETLSLVWLGDVIEMPHQAAAEDARFLQVVVLAAGGKRIAFVVDEVLGEQEVLVKSLGPQLKRVRNVEAATVLGSGKAVPILNVADLLKSALQISVSRFQKTAVLEQERLAQEKTVLVVEDSVTARSLLKGVLEMAGYIVATAVDGIDALTQLHSNQFDIVVSDVEMPRMNGFDLTAKIRGDKKLGELPVVLVTALESREDRERGIDVGANAYIVKRSFEQGNLLEVMQRLI